MEWEDGRGTDGYKIYIYIVILGVLIDYTSLLGKANGFVYDTLPGAQTLSIAKT